jgi:hypothetical protein
MRQLGTDTKGTLLGYTEFPFIFDAGKCPIPIFNCLGY